MTAVLETKRLTVRFGGLTAVNGLDLVVQQGTIHGVIGPNGSGKTTLFNLITGFYRPTSGEILLDGRPIGGLPPYAIVPMGAVRTFQNIRLFRSLGVLDNVMIGHHTRIESNLLVDVLSARSKRHIERDARERCIELLKMFHLEDLRDQPAGSLPYGRQRELEIARALAANPRVLLLDEPAAGMSPEETHRLSNRIQQIQAQGVTVLLVEHDMRLVMGICNLITVLDSGEKIAEGTPGEVQNHERVREAYLGRLVPA